MCFTFSCITYPYYVCGLMCAGNMYGLEARDHGYTGAVFTRAPTARSIRTMARMPIAIPPCRLRAPRPVLPAPGPWPLACAGLCPAYIPLSAIRLTVTPYGVRRKIDSYRISRNLPYVMPSQVTRCNAFCMAFSQISACPSISDKLKRIITTHEMIK